MRVAVYTAVFGSVRDRLFPLIGVAPDPAVSFVCFSDRKDLKPPEPWEVRPAAWVHNKSPRRTARYHKIMVHKLLPDFTHWVWMDACLQLACSPTHIIDSVNDARLAAFKHPQRDCVYREMDACRRLRKDSYPIMRKQTDLYRYMGLAPHSGLAETACVVRRNSEEVNAFSVAWWQQVYEHSVRDQLSFPFVSWRQNLPFSIIPGCRDRSSFFVFHKIRHSGERS